ncbi:MAG: hemerythrin domain-containing protein [Proteobacteria bacterium]|nr:hemerythrin domain-containing protein [Pseudomonadota bacterium]
MYQQNARWNAVDYIETDHRLVEALFEEFEQTASDDDAAKVLERLLTRLALHGQLEHALLYPALRRFGPALGRSIDEAERDHAALDECIAQILEDNEQRRPCRARVSVLKQYVSGHVQREETHLLPMARICGIDLEALGDALYSRHQRLLAFGLTPGVSAQGGMPAHAAARPPARPIHP